MLLIKNICRRRRFRDPRDWIQGWTDGRGGCSLGNLVSVDCELCVVVYLRRCRF